MAASPFAGLRRVEHIMGMPIGIDVRDGNVDPEVLDRVFDWLRWVDATFSTYRLDSEISRINAGSLHRSDAHPDVRRILVRCERLRGETDGYFDIRVPYPPPPTTPEGAQTEGSIDPSGLVKGWSIERGARFLDLAGARNYSINAGGDVVTRGRPSPDEPYWRIGIRHPYQHDMVASVAGVTDGAVATSGTYERGEHIVDPHSGTAPQGVLSVTIVGPDLGTADAYATAAFAMGPAGPDWTRTLRPYSAMTILADDTVLKTADFPSVPVDEGIESAT